MRIQYNLTLAILHSKTKYVNKRDTFVKKKKIEKSNPQMFSFNIYIYIYIYIFILIFLRTAIATGHPTMFKQTTGPQSI